ncbi:hypothetical protein MAPG_10568 [Magnaporthiopsis poae ATCC 64411]|uniref:Uncharacterized protein n=1 Tax=Magnaporthiopsis poae (strain ATCC 64411 / 73-15) TaxID=644358 RepID=A0A0C4ECX9_MAGP6|nr:hypothetical protein MAPG_10568 [Magnaporthiopsis poae ATCC 64411]
MSKVVLTGDGVDGQSSRVLASGGWLGKKGVLGKSCNDTRPANSMRSLISLHPARTWSRERSGFRTRSGTRASFVRIPRGGRCTPRSIRDGGYVVSGRRPSQGLLHERRCPGQGPACHILPATDASMRELEVEWNRAWYSSGIKSIAESTPTDDDNSRSTLRRTQHDEVRGDADTPGWQDVRRLDAEGRVVEDNVHDLGQLREGGSRLRRNCTSRGTSSAGRRGALGDGIVETFLVNKSRAYHHARPHRTIPSACILSARCRVDHSALGPLYERGPVALAHHGDVPEKGSTRRKHEFSNSKMPAVESLLKGTDICYAMRTALPKMDALWSPRWRR